MSKEFPFLPVICAYMGSRPYYLADEKTRAAARKAPWDCTGANEPEDGFRRFRDAAPDSAIVNHIKTRHPDLYAEFKAREAAGTLD